MIHLILALLAYLIPTFALGFVWHLMAFHSSYAKLGIYRPDPIIPFGFGSMALQGILFALAYPHLFDTAASSWIRSGALAGLSFAALSWSFTTLAVAAKHPMSSIRLYFVLETSYTLIQFAMVGPLMALAWRS